MRNQLTTNISIWRWQVHRILVDQIGRSTPFSSDHTTKKLLFLSEINEISSAQIFPFFLHARDIAAEFKIEARELPLAQFLQGSQHYRNTRLDAVCVQTSFNLTASELECLMARIKSAWPDARVAYFDWFAPTDLRYAEALTPHVAAYVKKQIFKDFKRYSSSTLGDTNLTDFYAKRFNLNLPKRCFFVPPEFRHKLVVGSGFEYSPTILKNLHIRPSSNGRSIDLHARIATTGTEWYSRMRSEALAKTEELVERFSVLYQGRVSHRQYMLELRRSKLCFSPFGYGEVCWRDFEAMSTGTLLLKPDMSHLRLVDDFFQSYQTYVPLSWDLSDLREKVEYYINHPLRAREIAHYAFEQLRRRQQQKRFTHDMSLLWKLLHLI